jgi:hypothetical protein
MVADTRRGSHRNVINIKQALL